MRTPSSALRAAPIDRAAPAGLDARPPVAFAGDDMHRLPHCVFLVATWPVLAQAPVAPLVGTVLDPGGLPAANATVRVSRCDGRLFLCLDTALRHEWTEVAQTTTDRRGRFGLQVPLGLALRVEVDLPPYAFWIREAVVPGEDLPVQLERACVATGQLTHGGTGKGTPGHLRAWLLETRVELFRGRTDGEGRFRFERLPAGSFLCDVEPDEASSPEWHEVRLQPGETWTYTPRLEPGVELTGTVTDAATGEPIAGARIGEGWTLHKAVRSDAAGRYTMHGSGDRGRPDLHCEAPGYERVRVDRNARAADTTQQDFALQRGIRVVGTVVDAAGKPVVGAYVAAVGSANGVLPWLPTRTAADGTFVCDGFPHRTEGVLMVRCAGHASVVFGLPRPAGDGQIDFGLARLPRPRLVQGVAHDPDRRPAANVQVCLRGVNADALERGPLPSTWPHLRIYLGERSVRTDAAGRFAFGDVAPGDYAVAFGSYTDATTGLAEVRVTADRDPPALQLSR